MAGNRLDRPMEYVPVEKLRQQLICPFCKGNEAETPPALAAYRVDRTLLCDQDDPSAWLTRVVNNKYPSFSQNGSTPSNTNDISSSCGPIQVNHSAGSQELVIPSPRHVDSLSDLTEDELKLSFWVCQERIRHLKQLSHIRHAMLFLNCRADAGASLSHLHTQLIGSPILGGLLRGRVQRNVVHAKENGCSLMNTLLNWEISQEERVLELSDSFCVFCPRASRFPYQIWIVPRRNENDFCDCPDAMRDEAAELCQKWVGRLETGMNEPSYNLLLHAEPFLRKDSTQEEAMYRHWYFELFPRLTRAAGYEWGTDIWVNPVSPETAAKRLKAMEK